MIIKHAILHIMDFTSDVCVFSASELDLTEGGAGEFIEKHLSRLMDDAGSREGAFSDYSVLKQALEKYCSEAMRFTDFASAAGNLLYDQLSRADEPERVDFLVCRFSEEGAEYMGLLLLPNKTAYTHRVEQLADGASNKIIRYLTMLPGVTQKISCYALIRLDDFQIRFCDKKRSVNGEELSVLADRVLQCAYAQSARDTVKLIKKAAGEVAEEFGANSAVAVTRAKSRMIENAEQSVPFTPDDLCEEVFAENEVMKEAFKEKVRDAGIPPKISVENPKVVKSMRSHKLKTDTGIEIKIPTEYLEDDRYVEFVNNPDGTISIALKNIGKIVNR